ncbi:Oidioi.mRNA.OKI2018_I69.PAR.g10546.t1.cds [Oikopleura dioica]|uniref:Oidioi.mRNA.OKI2018_I69.PAR.g10546.t1.cds n=1 Tax=Oikopleura dioica TaxID=34765 RepID=A0ABN7RR35_OIKDI|nr:Oidioi.mRNA.OKI2018_I69.PAR.g10546.t1.cds [Oikopleura dioica]
MLKEKDAGITQFRCENPSLRGIIKHRWSDFHVREIGLDGSVAKLTKFDVPKSENEEVKNEEPKIEVLTEEQLEILKAFIEKTKESKEGEVLLDFPTDCSKELRTQYHKQIKQQFGVLETFTLKEENKIRAKWIKKGGKGDRRNKRRDPKKKEEKFKFVLWKENMDTTAAVDHLCRILRVNAKLFNFAGTKDKRAITAQFVTSKLTPEVLIVANKKLKNIKVGNFELHNGDHLTLGDLKGNEFNIVLRDCELVSENDEPESKRIKPDFSSIVAKAYKSLNEKGFVNYYGLQRFGTSAIATHEIGIEILKENYAGAVDLLLKPRDEPKRNSFLTETRRIWSETKDAAAALEKLPKKFCNEGKVLCGLKDKPNDFVGALGRLTRPMRQMYVHAVQSYIWNRLASYRLTLGEDLMIGDLVQPNENEKLKVQLLSEENMKNFTIEDLVITIPGFDVSYSPLLAEFMDKELAALGLSRESFAGNVKDYRLPGGYRKMIVVPKDAEANVLMYSSNEENLLKSEREEFPDEMGEGLLGDKNEKGENGEKVKVGISLKIKLPPSAYATMALREFMHCDHPIVDPMKGFNVMAMPVAVNSKEYQNKMLKGFETLTMDLYSEMIQTKKDKNQKEVTDLIKMIKSLQRSNQREKDDLVASHKEAISRLLKTHQTEVEQAADDLRTKIRKETEELVAKTKKSPWCALCHQPAALYCCWNTNYCSQKCQTKHWTTHGTRCDRAPNKKA